MSMCRCAPSSWAWRSSARSRGAASRWPRSGASGRSSGVSAETFTERFARGSGPTASCSSSGSSLEAVVRAGQRRERVGAARGVAVGLGGGDGRLAEQVDRRGDPVAPELAQRGQRGPRVLADDEAVRHVAHAGRAGGAERRAAGLRVAHPHRRAQRRRPLADLVEEAGQVRGEVVERAAGGDDVDEAKQRGAQLVVLGGEVHRAVVERLERMAAVRRERVVQRAPDALDLGLERRGRVRAAVAHGVSPYGVAGSGGGARSGTSDASAAGGICSAPVAPLPASICFSAVRARGRAAGPAA